MSDTVIKVEGLSKLYRIGHREEYHTLRDTIAKSFSKSLRLSKRSSLLENSQLSALSSSSRESLSAPSSPLSADTIWALKDISFNIKRGEVVGIIGHNGAGKSTLLKILSRITEPTEGHAEIRGRVGSLLEVGTGFHPELSGRENIYLNGAILGMKKAEIERKFDEIVGFAEVEKFIDTPVKHYSSGMYVRLAFAVAAHLEPEILLVDEVLAVGDIAFQKKCLGKMENVSKEGRTVLFVSHSIPAIQNLCRRVLLLKNGKLLRGGQTEEILDEYFRSMLPQDSGKTSLTEIINRSGDGSIRLKSFHVEDEEGNAIKIVLTGMSVVFVFGYECMHADPKNVDVCLAMRASSGQLLFVLYNSYQGQIFKTVPAKGEFRCRIDKFPFTPGRYGVFSRVVVDGQEADWLRDSIGYIDVQNGDFYGTGHKGFERGVPFLLQGDWGLR